MVRFINNIITQLEGKVISIGLFHIFFKKNVKKPGYFAGKIPWNIDEYQKKR